MIDKLKKHWKVNGTQLFLVVCVFALTGSLTAWLSRQINLWLEVEKYSFLFWFMKIMVIFFGYQIIILLVSIPFGQFSFFLNYEKKILRRIGLLKKEVVGCQTPHTDR